MYMDLFAALTLVRSLPHGQSELCKRALGLRHLQEKLSSSHHKSTANHENKAIKVKLYLKNITHLVCTAF